MGHNFIMKKTLLVICTSLALIPSISWATLGEATQTNTMSSRQRMLKSTPNTANPLYTVQNSQTDAGVTIKEYARSDDGTVFAVSWSGPVRPDMKQLLGNYFKQFIEASQPGSPPRINKDDLVLQSGGHMGDFFGKAYLPKLIPDGVNIDDLE